MTDREAAVPADRVDRAIGADVPRIYFNGFASGYSPGDIVCALERNGEPIAIINMSYTVAKTLSASLAQLVGALEERSDQPIMTTHEVAALLGHAPAEEPKSMPAEGLEPEPTRTKSRKKKSG